MKILRLNSKPVPPTRWNKIPFPPTRWSLAALLSVSVVFLSACERVAETPVEEVRQEIKVVSLGGDTALALGTEAQRGQTSTFNKNAQKGLTPLAPLARLVIDDFDDGNLVNKLGGDSGTWELNPDDPDQGCSAKVDSSNRRGEKGYGLRLEYDVETALRAVNGYWTHLRSLDARGYDHLEFWISGDGKVGFTTTFKIQLKKFEKTKEGVDEPISGSFIVTGVTDSWQMVRVPLNKMTGIIDWSGLRELVISFEDRRVDDKTGVIYIDDIALIETGLPQPKITDIVPRKAKTKEWMSGEPYAHFLVKRLKGFPKEVIVKKKFPKEDGEFLMAVARDTWRYFDEIMDKQYHLPLDYIEFSPQKVMSDKTVIGDYTNITNIGLYLISLVSAYDFGFITREEAIRRISATLDSVEELETYNGFLYNYYDTTIFQRTSNFVSSVDSGWVLAGLVVVRNAFKELYERCTKLIEQRDFSFFYDDVDQQLYHGYWVNVGAYPEYHYGTFYTEPRVVSYLAIGKGDVPKEHWFRLYRTFPEEWAWQSQRPRERVEKECLGYKLMGGYYIYKDIKLVPSWGGSMFEALMPTLVLDEKALAPKGLGLNDLNHVRAQIKYALEEKGYPVWGMSPCAVPEGGYSEYGVKPTGTKGYGAGVVTPYATFLALEFAPEEAIANLKKLLELYDIYGEYGFYDAVNVETGLVATKYHCLDQAMIFIALNNYLNDGAIRKRFHQDEINRSVEMLLRAEDFFGSPEASSE